MEGPISPAELVEILQRTVEEQGLAFGSARAKLKEKIRADRSLREEQDAAYLASLQIDKVSIQFGPTHNSKSARTDSEPTFLPILGKGKTQELTSRRKSSENSRSSY